MTVFNVLTFPNRTSLYSRTDLELTVVLDTRIVREQTTLFMFRNTQLNNLIVIELTRVLSL